MRRRFEPEELAEILSKTKGYCRYCGKQLARGNYGRVGDRGAWEVDHSNPISRGGTNLFRNLWPACVECNTEKGTLTGSEYQRLLDGGRHETSGADLGELIGGIVVVGLAVLVLCALFGKPKTDAW